MFYMMYYLLQNLLTRLKKSFRNTHITLLLIIIVLISLMEPTIVYGSSDLIPSREPPLTYSNKPVNILKNLSLYIIPINCGRSHKSEFSGVIIDTLYGFIHSILFYNYTVSSLDERALVGKRLYSRIYYDDEYQMYVAVIRYENIEYIYTSIGYFKAVYGSGRAPSIRFFGDNNNISSIIRGYARFSPTYGSLHDLNVSVIYGGIDAESWREIGYSTCIKTSEGVVCNGSGIRIEYVDPYEKYYIVVDGVRIGFPIKIRGYRGEGKRLAAQYIEGFIPCKCDGRKPKRIIVDDRLIHDIENIYFNAFKEYGLSGGELVINDIYYAISSDVRYLVPQIVVSMNGSYAVAVIQLTREGPILISKQVLQGPYEPSDPVIELKIKHDGIGKGGNNISDIIVATTIIALAILVPVSVLLYLRRRHR